MFEYLKFSARLAVTSTASVEMGGIQDKGAFLSPHANPTPDMEEHRWKPIQQK